MLCPKRLRTDLEAIEASLASRGFVFPREEYLKLESARKASQVVLEERQAQRNAMAKAIGEAKRCGEDTEALTQESLAVNEALEKAKRELAGIAESLDALLAGIPNVPSVEVAVGASEADNVEISRHGTPRVFDFPVRDHVDVGTPLGLDMPTAAAMSGARFSILKGQLARLQRALIQFMLDVHTTEHGYQEHYVPFIVNDQVLFGVGQLPKFQEDLFQLTQGQYLIPTAEAPLTAMATQKIWEETELPCQWVAHTPCFRSEAGAYGRDTRGFIRQHQFEKVELVHITTPEKAPETLLRLRTHAEVILQRLELPYRVVQLCTGDLGFSACQTFDLEVWLPSQDTYREISSCSHFGDFQARRFGARYRPPGGKPTEVHTLNGSGLAVGRTLVAILENFQQSDGSVVLPEALAPYWKGLLRLSPEVSCD